MTALIGLRYLLLFLMVPAYVVALSRRKWTMVPLWLVSTSVMLTQFFMSAQQRALPGGVNASEFVYVGEMIKVMLIPAIVQCAVLWHGMQPFAGKQRNKSPHRLVEAEDTGNR